MTIEPVAAPDLAQIASEAIGAPNPMIGVSVETIARSALSLVPVIVRQPGVFTRDTARMAVEMAMVLAGRCEHDPSADPRFRDNWWRRLPYSLLAKEYLTWRAALYRFVEDSLPRASSEQAQLAAGILAEAWSPTNNLLGNPAALRQLWRTRGQSLVTGTRHLVHDIRHNGGMPSLAYPGRYRIGVDLAASPGAVVHRTPTYELLQYRPQRADVHRIPVVMIPSPVNKYYFLDLAPGRSLVEYALRRGLQFFAISWRNPTASQHDWSLEHYARAADDACSVAATIAGTEAANSLGVCAGGTISSLMLGYRAATGQPMPSASSYLVSGIDTAWPSSFGEMAGMTGADAAVNRSRRKGVMPGRDLSRAFGLLRPNELIWGMFVNNYLLGNDPPSTDVLAWNTDVTNLPAALHADLMRVLLDNPLAQPDGALIAGVPIDLAKVTVDSYTLGALDDHIVPWQSCYASARLFGGESRFVAASAGHVQGLVNPPGHPRSRYRTGPDQLPDDPNEWMAMSTEHTGTWWDDWILWVTDRSGELGPAPTDLGCAEYPPLMPAPGRYVHQVAA